MLDAKHILGRKRVSQYLMKKSPYFSSVRKAPKELNKYESLALKKHGQESRQVSSKKKPFQRKSKFVSIENLPLKKEKSYDKNLANSIQTLFVATKYQSYKSIPITPKEKHFRTKTKPKHNFSTSQERSDDWFQKEIIQNEIYATEEDFD